MKEFPIAQNVEEGFGAFCLQVIRFKNNGLTEGLRTFCTEVRVFLSSFDKRGLAALATLQAARTEFRRVARGYQAPALPDVFSIIVEGDLNQVLDAARRIQPVALRLEQETGRAGFHQEFFVRPDLLADAARGSFSIPPPSARPAIPPPPLHSVTYELAPAAQ